MVFWSGRIVDLAVRTQRKAGQRFTTGVCAAASGLLMRGGRSEMCPFKPLLMGGVRMWHGGDDSVVRIWECRIPLPALFVKDGGCWLWILF